MIFGYARVSTQEQNLDAQLEALSRAGAERIFSEKISGKDAKRPELQALVSQLRRGDVVTVTKYDRLSRSLPDLLLIVSEIEAQGADFASRAEAALALRRFPSHPLAASIFPPLPWERSQAQRRVRVSRQR